LKLTRAISTSENITLNTEQVGIATETVTEPEPQKPLFTVVMPCFCAHETVVTALASVLGQSEADFEMIVVDDGSPDSTAAIVLQAANGDPRVRLLRQQNAGPAAARNNGVAAGSGRLIAFLDADDRWAADLLARHRDCFNRDDKLGMSFARVCFYDPALLQPGAVSAYAGQLSLQQMLGENPICTTSNIVARRAAFEQAGGFDETMKHAEDQEWAARVLATTCWKVVGMDAVLVDYRMSKSGLSADLDSMQSGWRAMIERVRGYAPAEVAKAEAGAAALFERYLTRRALRTGQAGALGHMLAAFRHSPVTLLTNAPKRTLLTAAMAFASILLPASLVRTISR
jgi:hypothetical protein